MQACVIRKSACGTLYLALSSRQGNFKLLVTIKGSYNFFNSLSCTPIQIENTCEIAPPLQMHSFGRMQESGP